MSNSKVLRPYAKRLHTNTGFRPTFHEWKSVVDDKSASEEEIQSIGKTGDRVAAQTQHFIQNVLTEGQRGVLMAGINLEEVPEIAEDCFVNGTLAEANIVFMARLLVNEIRLICNCV